MSSKGKKLADSRIMQMHGTPHCSIGGIIKCEFSIIFNRLVDGNSGHGRWYMTGERSQLPRTPSSAQDRWHSDSSLYNKRERL